MKTVIGIDYGTQSARAILVDARDGHTLKSIGIAYPHGVLPGNLASAEDYETVLLALLDGVIPPECRDTVAGICVDATSLTLVPMDASLRALSHTPGLENAPHAQIKLWKHHAAQKQAEEATQLAREMQMPFLERIGWSISSEWTLPKLLQIRDEAPEIYEKIDLAMDLCEYLTFLLTGDPVRCAGPMAYKNLWSEEHGFPSDGYLDALRPGFAEEYRHLLRGRVVTPGRPAGLLRPEICQRLGLKGDVAVSAGMIDGQAGPAAVGAVRDGDAVLVIGTSNVLTIQSSEMHAVHEVCGIGRDVMIPGLWGMESGQSCTGDMLDWMIRNALPEEVRREAAENGLSVHELLSARVREPWNCPLTALDWFNGSRNAPCDLSQRAIIAGLSLDTKPEDLYLAMLQGIACGTREIIEQCGRDGLPVKRMLATGGIVGKNPLLMQEYANILNMPIDAGVAPEGPALGASVYAAAAAGLYPGVVEAQAKMGFASFQRYWPDPKRRDAYENLFRRNHALREMARAWSRILL